MQEVWKDIVGYEGLYQVSNLGRVKSLDRVTFRRYNGGAEGYQLYKGQLIKNIIDKDGYCTLDLWKNKQRIRHKVHRLVAQAFVLNPNDKPLINHKDGNKQNNHVDNLEWCDARENQIHSIEILGNKQSKETIQKRARKQCKKVLCLELNKMFNSAQEASIWLGLNNHAVTHCIARNGKTGGYHWRYL